MKKSVSLLLLALLTAVCLHCALGEEAPTLRYNSKGDAVTALQRRLRELGYYTFHITGIYQENTQRAVRAFQAEYGLRETGEADAVLQALIHNPFARPKPTPTPKPTSTPRPTPTPLSMKAPYPGRLEFGSAGEDVRRVQTRLFELGFYAGEISGNFLGNTRNAVRDFQRHNVMAADGVVGEQTWQALFFDEQARGAYEAPKPTPEPTPVPYRVEVNVTTQVTSVYGLDEEGEYTNLVRHMLCSTGTASDPTPLKTYTLNGEKARWCYFPKWGTHAQYWTRMDASNAFHSVIYSEPDPMALKTGSYTGLGKRASHGCVRLMLEDAKWIYENCGKGTRVVVYEGKADEELTKSLKIPPLDYSVMLPRPTAAPTAPPAYSAFAQPPMPFTTLERGVENVAVYWLQCRLTELGYYKGSITGGYYGGTAEAVKAFQRDNGLAADGKAGVLTQSKLYEALLATPEPVLTREPAITRAPVSMPGRTVSPTPARTAAPMPTRPPSNSPWFEATKGP
ncbi:MAG: peptidoglycan-binding protein [Firmicutes bacterium]|nr:peptidoglycan-binding protein [Bacillota bacterium]